MMRPRTNYSFDHVAADTSPAISLNVKDNNATKKLTNNEQTLKIFMVRMDQKTAKHV